MLQLHNNESHSKAFNASIEPGNRFAIVQIYAQTTFDPGIMLGHLNGCEYAEESVSRWRHATCKTIQVTWRVSMLLFSFKDD